MIKNYKLSKAFTFAELMISLVIIAVITVILYPTIADLAPNNNKVLFKSTYKTIETIVSEISTSSEIPFFTATSSNVTNADMATACMCHEFEDRLNTIIPNNGTGCAPSPTACPNGQTYIRTTGGNNTFVTTNGVRWAFQYNTADNTFDILVDVNASNNTFRVDANNIKIETQTNPKPNLCNASGGDDCSNIWLNASGGAKSAQGIYYTNNAITQDTFFIKVQATGDTPGKISIENSIGYTHLQDKD